MNNTAAIFYQKNAYDATDKRLLGRQAAGEGFLKALIKYGINEHIYCYTPSRAAFTEFCDRIQPWMIQKRQVTWLSSANPKNLAQVGTLYQPDPMLLKHAWARRFSDQKAYSICGVTHTIASYDAMERIGNLLIAPLQPWDALICTSQAVKTAIERLLHTWADYLAQRTGGKPPIEIQLPIIPLGVDCDFFPQGQDAINIRQQLRQTLGIPQDDIVVLFVGRLCFFAKAHPVPMYLALEKAAQATKAKIHLVHAGWFEDEREEAGFKESIKQFCPDVNSIFVDGRQPKIRREIWSCADIFISLVDNIQETFGLTPIEAMASGLPAIVSDWNGYKESVRHQIYGFRIPTLMPPPGSGLDIAKAYCTDNLNYSNYLAHCSMASTVDIDAASTALVELIENPELRKKLGENGRQRAKETYDWQVVIAAYEKLWQELASIRSTAQESVPLQPSTPPYPLCDDPFRLFGHYPTNKLTSNVVLKRGANATPSRLQQLRQNWITNFGADSRVNQVILDEILSAFTVESSLSVKTIVLCFPNVSRNYLISTLMYLVKFDVLKVES